MNRLSRFILFIFVITSILILNSSPVNVAFADPSQPRKMTIIVVDNVAVKQAENGIGLMKSVVGLISTLNKDHHFGFIGLDNPSNVLGPIDLSSPDRISLHQEIYYRLESIQSHERFGLTTALMEAHHLFTSQNVAPGSSVYVVLGSPEHSDYSQLDNRLAILADQFGSDGWLINGVVFEGQSDKGMQVLDKLSTNSGGEVIELNVTNGLSNFSKIILQNDSDEFLMEAGSNIVESGDVFTTEINILPGTSKTELLFFTEMPLGTLKLTTPSGFESLAREISRSVITEMSNAVLVELTDPMPGYWKIQVENTEGFVSVWENSLNAYELILIPSGSIPLNKPVTLMAYVHDGKQLVTLDGVRIFAEIKTPDGISIVREMFDMGVATDVVAGDGYFSAVLPDLSVAGQYEAQLKLSWDAYDYEIFSQVFFEAQSFPILEVHTIKLDNLDIGVPNQVATVSVHLNGVPYPVTSDLLTAAVSTPNGEILTLDLEPKMLFGGNGPAWEYDAHFTPNEQGLYTMMFQLTTEYSGKIYTDTSNSIVVSAIIPDILTQTIDVSEGSNSGEMPQHNISSESISMPLGFPQLQLEDSGLHYAILLLLLIIGGVVALALIGFAMNRTRPYGFLYNDQDEPLVDFANLKRHPLVRFFYRNSVSGGELGVPGLEGVKFEFLGNRIQLRSSKGQPTVRVDNHPIVKQAIIEDKSWIGVDGKLYSFFLSTPPRLSRSNATK